jgi:hypothetical protein
MCRGRIVCCSIPSWQKGFGIRLAVSRGYIFMTSKCILTSPQVVEGLVKIGKRLGVEYRFTTPIQRILLSPDGSSFTADIVICNANLVYAYNNLLPSSSTATSLSTRKASCSGISFYWSLTAPDPALKAETSSSTTPTAPASMLSSKSTSSPPNPPSTSTSPLVSTPQLHH